jgi:hypothetical protein
VNATTPTVEVLSLPGCPSAGETVRMALAVADALLPGTRVMDVRLSEAEAVRRGFPGSPTVLVNGKDIEGRGPNASGAA